MATLSVGADIIVHMFESELSAVSSHPVAAALNAAESLISNIEDVPMWSLGPDELAGLVVGQEALTARVAALGLRLVREADRRELGSSVGATSTADWLRDRLRLDHGVAKGRVELAALLDVDAQLLGAAGMVHAAGRELAGAGRSAGYPDPAADGADRADSHGVVVAEATAAATAAGVRVDDRARSGLGIPVAALAELTQAAHRYLPCTAWALRAGTISVEHAQVIRRALKRLPAAIDSLTWAESEAFLAVQATRHDPRNLARLGSHLATAVTGAHELSRQHEREAASPQPASDEPTAPGAGERLDNDRPEERAEATTMFGFVENGDGTVRATGASPPKRPTSSPRRWLRWPRPTLPPTARRIRADTPPGWVTRSSSCAVEAWTTATCCPARVAPGRTSPSSPRCRPCAASPAAPRRCPCGVRRSLPRPCAGWPATPASPECSPTLPGCRSTWAGSTEP
nr:DUF222 domain-containing protein [Jiangella alkaliphila]